METEKRGTKILPTILIILIVVAGGILVYNNTQEKQPIEDKTVVVDDNKKEDALVNDQLQKMQQQISALQQEVKTLKSEIKQLKSNTTTPAIVPNPPQTTQKATTVTNTTSSQPQTPSKNDITMTKFSCDWVDSRGTIALKNNLQQEVTAVKGRVIYYDMKGEMLDYVDFTKKITIAPGMTKSFEVNRYGYSESYAYYKGQVRSSTPDRKFKVEFQLQGYNVK